MHVDSKEERLQKRVQQAQAHLQTCQEVKKKTRESANKAKNRIIQEKKMTPHNSRPKPLVRQIADCRYMKKNGIGDLSVAATATLANNILMTEWKALVETAEVREELLSHLKSKPVISFELPDKESNSEATGLGACTRFLKTLSESGSRWTRWFLLEMVYEVWKDDIPTLFEGINSLKEGVSLPVSKKVAVTTAIREPTEERPRIANQQVPAETTTSPGDPLMPLPSMVHVTPSLDPTLGSDPGQAATTIADLTPEEKKKAILEEKEAIFEQRKKAILEFVSSRRLTLEKSGEVLRYIANMSRECISDLYKSIFDGIGMQRPTLANALVDLQSVALHTVNPADITKVQDILDLPLSVQISADVDGDGDLEIKIRVSRVDGLHLMRKYTWPLHKEATLPNPLHLSQ